VLAASRGTKVANTAQRLAIPRVATLLKVAIHRTARKATAARQAMELLGGTRPMERSQAMVTHLQQQLLLRPGRAGVDWAEVRAWAWVLGAAS